MVEAVHIKIGKYLTGKVAYWQTALGLAVKKAFVQGQIVPVAFIAFNDAIFCRVVEYYLLAKFYYQIFVGFIIFLFDKLFEFCKKYVFVYAHKKALQIEF